MINWSDFFNMSISTKIETSLANYGVAILPPMDFFESSKLINDSGIKGKTSILDPWYNKGIGGVLLVNV